MCACTKLTAIDPSPTADATRFTEPLRTSPAANTPGRLVSSRNGARPGRPPALGVGGARRQLGSGQHEALAVQLHAAAEPGGVGVGADEEEERAGLDALRARRAVAGPAPRPGGRSPRGRSTAHPRWIVDVLQALDPVHQIPRHAGAEIRLPHHARGPGGRTWRGRRSPAPPSCRRRPPRPPRPGRAAPPSRWRRSRSRRPRSPRSSGRRACGRTTPLATSTQRARSRVPSVRVTIRSPPSMPSDRTVHGTVMLGAELLRLEQRVPGQLPPRDAGREAEVVLDPRAGARLAARARGTRRSARRVPRTPRRPRRRAPRGRRRRPPGRRRGPPPCATPSPCTRRCRRATGLLCHSPSPSITIGVAEAGTLNCRSSASACSSVSRSRNRNGMPLRVAKSRSRCASGEKREPMMRTPSKPSSSRSAAG